MVSFQCAKCGEVFKKPKVVGHAATCRTAMFSCVDCMENFDLHSIVKHTSCMTEAHRYQGAWKVATNGVVKAKVSLDSDEEGTAATELSAPGQKRRRLMTLSSDSSDDDSAPKSKPPAVANSDSHLPAPLKKLQVEAAARVSSKQNSVSSCVDVGGFTLDASSSSFLDVVRNILETDGVVDASAAGGKKHASGKKTMNMAQLTKCILDRYSKRIGKCLQKNLQVSIEGLDANELTVEGDSVSMS